MEPNSSSTLDMSGKLILITDDNPVNIEFIKLILEKNRYRTSCATNGEECIQITEKIRPDLILLDISMPKMSGINVCRILKENKEVQHIPIIFVTAHTDNATLKDAFDSGGTDYVRKPINKIELLARIQSALIAQELTLKIVRDEKLKSILEMAGAVCHELNQPLQYIAGATELLLMNLEKKHPHFEDLHKIKEQVDRMGAITRKLMGITSYETRDYVGETRIVDLDKSSTLNL